MIVCLVPDCYYPFCKAGLDTVERCTMKDCNYLIIRGCLIGVKQTEI